MPRKGAVSLRRVVPDLVFQSQNVTRLVNKVMTRGKKSLAERIVYAALESVQEKGGKEPAKVLDAALHNIMPVLEVKPRRVGGATYQVPIEVRPERRMSLGIRWLVQYARQRPGRTMRERLAAEILDASNNAGAAVKRREDTHKMAEANKAFAHYRW
jgi:small subunit ribosomal protein S7